MLLNVLQRPDGTIDEEARYLLEELAKWFAVCAEGVDEIRPFRVFGEGDTRVVIDGFHEERGEWNFSDFRFTRENDTVYAFMMQAPDNRVAVIKSLRPEEKVESVRLLGAGEVEFVQSLGVLTVKLLEKLSTEYANCLALKLAGV